MFPRNNGFSVVCVSFARKQKVRYRPGEKFTWHLDALPPAPDLEAKGGQRTATLLVYLTDMPEGDGGATAFRDLGPLRVSCLLYTSPSPRDKRQSRMPSSA